MFFLCYLSNSDKFLMFIVKKLLTSVKNDDIVRLTINIKLLIFIVRLLARVKKE